LPAAIDAVDGVTAIDTSTADVTVSVTPGEVIPPKLAEMLDVPAAIPIATPEELIVAVAVLEDDHVTVDVRFCVVWFVKVPIAAYACVVPAAIDAVIGVTAIETSVAGATVSVTPGEVMPPWVAVIVVVPVVSPVATPAELMVAMEGFTELHATLLVRFCVVWLLNVPVAVYACVLPAAIDAVTGVTAMDVSTADVTVSVAPGELMPFCVAVIVVAPTATPVATPEVLIVAVGTLEEFQVTLFEMFCVVWLLNVPVAVYDSVLPAAIDAVAGVTAIDTKVGGVTVSVTPGEVMLPCAAVIVVAPTATLVATPEALIVAAGVLDDIQVTLLVRFCVVWLLKVPVAV
jgi:hypothetical protein